MNCFRCGAQVPETSRFCGSCGTLVSDPQSSTLVFEPNTTRCNIQSM